MRRRTHLAPLVLAVVAGLGTGLASCGPTVPGGTVAPEVSPGTSTDASPMVEPTPILPTVKPGSTEPPILTLEPPPPVVP